MKKVLVFGTFDLFHPGHESFLKEAKSYGDELHVVIARDSTVKGVKGKHPAKKEGERMDVLKALEYVDEVVLGHEGDKYAIIEEMKPDVICLGYDQDSFTKDLKKVLKERGLEPEIVRFDKGFKPEIHKSSKISADIVKQ